MADNDKNSLVGIVASKITTNNNQENTASRVRVALNAIITHCFNLNETTEQTVNGSVNFASGVKSYGKSIGGRRFELKSAAVTTVSSDASAPSFINGLEAFGDIDGFVLDASIGAIQNNTGATIAFASGLLSCNPFKSGGSVAELNLFSTMSSDKITWSKNTNSARVDSVLNAGQSLLTKPSSIKNWAHGDWLRFEVFASDSTVSLYSPSITSGGDTITGYSFEWSLQEI